jgi:glycosyltransferase involved in cell wall biosynthesis
MDQQVHGHVDAAMQEAAHAGRIPAMLNLVLLSHPAFTNSQSMPRFARMMEQAYLARGHKVQVWSPQAKFYKWVPWRRFSKWAGYVDQYLLFPPWVRKQLKTQAPDTLFVFCDQALGPWVPLVNDKPHVVHVHDLLALRSALGDAPENPTGWTGRCYQRYIRNGFRRARHFISISNKSRDDLHRFGRVSPITSEVVHNGLNYPYAAMPDGEARKTLKQAGLPVPAAGMLLHVSGNQWYKNVPGVIRLYARYAQTRLDPLPLWLVGPYPEEKLQAAMDEVPEQGKVMFFHGLDTIALQAAYSLSRAFLFPSLAEGFGWPIIEALACGCPVITTAEPPMNEVGGTVARYLPRLRAKDDVQDWAKNGADVLLELLSLDEAGRASLAAEGIAWAKRFDPGAAIEGYLRVYRQVIERENTRDE